MWWVRWGSSGGRDLQGDFKTEERKKIRFVCEGLFIRKQNRKEKYGGHTAEYVKQLSRIICLHYSNFILFVPFLESVVPFHPFLLLLLSFWLHPSYIKDGCSQRDIISFFVIYHFEALSLAFQSFFIAIFRWQGSTEFFLANALLAKSSGNLNRMLISSVGKKKKEQ